MVLPIIFIHLPFSLPEIRPKHSEVYKLPGLASRTDRLGCWNIDLEILQEAKSRNRLKLGDLNTLKLFDG